MKRYTLLALHLLLFAATTFGAGFQLNLQGLRQLAMGGTGTAVPWDASTIFYNPGGLSMLDGIQVYGGVQLIDARAEYTQLPTGNYSIYSQPQTFTTFNVYAGGPIKKGSKWGVGIGVYTPFGSGFNWGDNWAGKYVIQKINLQSVFVQPTGSYRINDMFSVGVGLIYGFGSVDFRQAIPVQDQSGNIGEGELKGNANGFGFNVGVHAKLSDKVQLGLTYRSQVKMKVNSGNADFTVPMSLENMFPNTNFSTKVPLPQVISLGVGFKPIDRLMLQADLEFVGWHSFDSLDFNYSTHTSELQDTHLPRLYKNTLAIRVGGNYELIKNTLAVMAGAAYDPTPVPDGTVPPDLPDANRIVLSCGLSYNPIRKLTIMAAFEYTQFAKRNASYDYTGFNGQYQTKAATPGLGVSYTF